VVDLIERVMAATSDRSERTRRRLEFARELALWIVEDAG
jgi:hypothetical protein